MPNLSSDSISALLKQLQGVDITVSPRGEGRTTEQCERWSICRFLAAYADTNVVRYPMRLEKRERPDFLLQLPGARVGIEVTEAVPPDWAWANARRDKLNYSNLIFLHRFHPGEPQRPVEEIDKIARSSNPGDGWAGDSPEREWAEVMLYFSLQKAEKLSKPGYQVFDENWLLIYDNWPVPAVEDAKAAAFFVQRLNAPDVELPFNRIFVECERSIWQFRTPAYSSQPIRDLWKTANPTLQPTPASGRG